MQSLLLSDIKSEHIYDLLFLLKRNVSENLNVHFLLNGITTYEKSMGIKRGKINKESISLSICIQSQTYQGKNTNNKKLNTNYQTEL